MEKASVYSNTKQHMKQMHDYKFRVSSLDYNTSFGERDLVGSAGFSWPPRSYVCSFCKREFRSAQALGGHMNVHRRDRARLRQSPTRDNGGNLSNATPLNLNLEPNPSFYTNPSSNSTSSLSTKFPQFTSKLPPPATELKRDAALVHSCRPITADFMKVRAAKGVLGVEKIERKKGFDGFKKQGFVRLDLEIGLINSPSKEELDLELRLGYT